MQTYVTTFKSTAPSQQEPWPLSEGNGGLWKF